MLATADSNAEGRQSAAVEAARYALLRRLAPSMRHHLVVNLQPIGMIYEVMDRRLRAPEPDLSHIQESAQRINTFARAALNSCQDVISWLAPDEPMGIDVGECASECASLLATSLSFRGFALRSEVGAMPKPVRRSAVRNVLTAALILLSDEIEPPAELQLEAQPQDAGAKLTLRLRPSVGEKGYMAETGYRKLAWADLQALAAAEGVQVAREGQHGIVMTVPWAQTQ